MAAAGPMVVFGLAADPYNYKDLKGATSVVLLDRQRNGLATIRSHTPGSNLRDMMTTKRLYVRNKTPKCLS